MTVGERVLSLLKEKGLKQKDLADRLRTGTSTISGWKQENRNPSCDMIIPICDFLGVSCEYLLTGNEGDTAVSDNEKDLLSLFRKLTIQEQRDFLGAIRIQLMMNGAAEKEEELREAK